MLLERLSLLGPLNSPSDPRDAYLLVSLDKRVEVQPEDETEVYDHILDMAPLFPPQHHPREILNLEVRPSKDENKYYPKVELKPLPSHSRYEFFWQMRLSRYLLMLVLMAPKLQNC